jgi:hypothetical protein
MDHNVICQLILKKISSFHDFSILKKWIKRKNKKVGKNHQNPRLYLGRYYLFWMKYSSIIVILVVVVVVVVVVAVLILKIMS